MKRLSIVIIIISLFTNISAQKYLRYHMNDSTFNGFYTDAIEKITHEVNGESPTSYVYSLGKTHEIPLNSIDSITVENANLADGDTPNYRIYEFNSQEGNVKKIYIDNRACLLASSNGDFGAKDTILFSSAYNNIKWLIFTNESGMIKKIFDGNKLFFFDYEENGDFTILDLSTNQTRYFENSNSLDFSSKKSSTRADPPIVVFLNWVSQNPEAIEFVGGLGKNLLTNLAGNIDEIQNNPENHNQQLIIDGLSLAGDVISVAGDFALIFGSSGTLSGWVYASLVSDVSFLFNDLFNLFEHISPSSEQMKIYKEYYKNKYSISLKTLPAENITFTSATLRGNLTYIGNLVGSYSFDLQSLDGIEIPGTVKSIDKYNYSITADAKGLNPGYYYYYYLKCSFTVDGLALNYTSDVFRSRE